MPHITSNENGNGSINGRGIKRRDLTHHELVELAADAVSGVHPVVPSLSQAPKIFEGVTQAEVSEELKRREGVRKDATAEKVLFDFADVWSERSPSWRAEALRWIAVASDLSDVRYALILAMK
jgi:hypothetical protein